MFFASLLTNSATIICPWGVDGAIALDAKSGVYYSANAYPPKQVVDSLGAGDTFVAATIHHMCAGHSLGESIDFGCRIAGAKVGLIGYDGIGALMKATIMTSSCDKSG